MMYSCSEKADELATKLAEKGYAEEVVSVANDLAKMVADYEEENPQDLPVVKTVEDGKYGKDKETEEEVETEEVDYTDMDEKDMKKSMKKSGIIITFEGK